MLLIIVSCMLLAVGVFCQELAPGMPMEPWIFECYEDHFLGGFLAEKYGTDHKMTMFCRSVKDRRDAALEVDACEWRQEFVLGEVSLRFTAADYNCKEGEYANAMHGEWRDGKRTLKFKCCKPYNTYVHWGLGCHSTNRTQGNLFKFATAGAKSPYEPRDDYNCPRYVWTGMEICGDGISVKFCPMGVNGATYYDIGCALRQTTKVRPTSVECPPVKLTSLALCPLASTSDARDCRREAMTPPATAVCRKDVDCVGAGFGPNAICCSDGCRDVCFAKIDCVQHKCFDPTYCPNKCWQKCKDWHKEAKETLSDDYLAKLLGWECSSTQDDTSFFYQGAVRSQPSGFRTKRHTPKCCCKYEYKNPACVNVGEELSSLSYLERLGGAMKRKIKT